MLPSMPLLFSSSRDSLIGDENNQNVASPSYENNDAIISTKESKHHVKLSISNDTPNITFASIPEDERECADELVLMAENSPFGEKRKLQSQAVSARKKKKIDVPEPLLDDKNSSYDQANHFATAYFMKAKNELDDQTFQKFITLLSALEEEKVNAVELFYEINELLSGYPNLSEEFIGFLLPHQALEANKLNALINFEQTRNFFRKIEAFHMNKVNNLLEQHASNPKITSEAVRASFQSTFKGHPNISEGFFSLLPDGKPPQSCHEDYEDISDLGRVDSTWETLNITESVSCGCVPGECDCGCHTLSVKKFCTFCNIKFSKGQIYVQTGKGLRFAKVTFRGCKQEEVLWRLNPTLYGKPSSRKRTKSTSQQNKETNIGTSQGGKCDIPLSEENRESDKALTSSGKYPSELDRTEEEDEIIFLESQLNNDLNSDEHFVDTEDIVLESTNSDEPEDFEFDGVDEFANDSSPISVKQDEDSHNSEQVSDTNDDINNSGNEPKNNLDEPAIGELSNAVVKTEPANDSCEADVIMENKNTEPEIEVKKESVVNEHDIQPSSSKETKVWTREEDKLILQAFQAQLSSENTFSKISNLMPSRTVDDIQGRFQVLMNILERMTSGCYDNIPP